jgi:hypothetical protein
LPPFGEARKSCKTTAQQEGRGYDAIAIVTPTLDDLYPLLFRPTPEGAIPSSHLFQQVQEKRSTLWSLELDVVENIMQGMHEPLHHIERRLTGPAYLDP